MNKDLEQLDLCLASLENSAKELKACMGESMPQDGGKKDHIHDKINALADNMYAAMASIRNHMWSLHDSHAKKMDDHLKGHVPPMKSNKHMEAFLKACDMTDEYKTSPKDVSNSSYSNMAYASKITATRQGMKVELDFTKPKN